MEKVYRLDYTGTPSDFKRTAQGFLRVNARLTRTGIFTYHDRREYRSDLEVFREDALASLKGAPVTDLHPSESGGEALLNPTNAKNHMVGLTEDIERDGDYLKGSLVIFHEDTIKAIERGERKEISLGYQCKLDPTPGTWNGEAYDAAQTNIIINHVAIGPKGWGRAGPECAIHTDSKEKNMEEIVRLDGVEVILTAELVLEKHRQVQEYKGRLDAVGLELEKERAERAKLEDPKAIDSKVQGRIKLVEKCRAILGNDFVADDQSDDELKLLVIKKFYPDLELSDKSQDYLDGVFEAICSMKAERNDSLTNTLQAIENNTYQKASNPYEKWVEQTAKLWTSPLTGSMRS